MLEIPVFIHSSRYREWRICESKWKKKSTI